jgi:hypothetical protein
MLLSWGNSQSQLARIALTVARLPYNYNTPLQQWFTCGFTPPIATATLPITITTKAAAAAAAA